MSAPNSVPVPVEMRLRRLERHNRVLFVVLIVLVGLFLLAGRTPQDTAELLSTRALQIVDENGHIRATLSGNADGAMLSFLDSQAVQRISLQHTNEDTALYVRDAQGTTRIGVAQFAHGGGGFALHGENAKGAAVLYLKGGTGSLTLYDREGNAVNRFPERAASQAVDGDSD